MTDLLGIPLATRTLPYELLMRYARVQVEIAETFGEPTIYEPEAPDVFAATRLQSGSTAETRCAFNHSFGGSGENFRGAVRISEPL